MTTDGIEEPRRSRTREIERGNYIRTLLNSITLEQVREAVYLLAPNRKLPIKKHADSEEVLKTIGATNDELENALLEAESRHPFKHCLLLRLVELPSAFDFKRENFSYNGTDFRLTHIRLEPNISLTFEHAVEFKEWVEAGPDTRTKKTFLIRQPIVVRILQNERLIVFSYPGFSHGGTEGGPAGYESVVECLIEILKRNFSINTRTIALKDTLGLLLEGSNRRVIRVKADVDSPFARLDLSSKGEGATIEQALGRFIAEHLEGVDQQRIEEAAKKAFNNSTVNSIVLYWIQEGLFTRLRFWDIGTELLFVWNNESASFHTVETIVKLLCATQELAGFEGSPLEWLSKLPPNTVITPGELCARKSLEPAASKDVLLRAMSAGLMEPVYRIKTNEILIEMQNLWSKDLNKFKRSLITESGQVIDGTHPENIEVAFERVAFAGKGETQ